MIVLTVANFKGGSGKTTTAAWMAHAFAESDLNTFFVDADPQQSATEWSAVANWPFPVAGLAVGNLHSRLSGVTGERDAVVIDTPPLEDHRAVVTSALRVATHVLIPCAPTPIEYYQLAKVQTVLDDVTPLRNEAPVVAVMMIRTRAGTASHPTHRDQIRTDGWTVLEAHAPLTERFGQSFGGPITKALDTAYGDAAAELLGIGMEVTA